MTLLSANDAAILAQSVYDALPAQNAGEAQQNVAQTLAAEHGPGKGKASLSGPVKAVGGLMGKSGAVVKDRTGFGVVLERGGGNAGELIVALRGTQSGSDWLSNINIGMMPGPNGSMVHAGFWGIYSSFRQELGRIIARENPNHIHFVGHSLGGALASLAAIDFLGSGTVGGSLYTFGSPRVGSIAMNATMRRCLPATNVRRVYAISDPVPMIPMLPFLHYGPGSIGINAGFNNICKDAHLMKTSYVPNMPSHGWPAMIAMPNRMDPDYWLDQAEQAGSLKSAFGYFCLSKALGLLLPIINGLSAGVTAFLTPIDMLADALTKGIQIAQRIGKTVLHFVKAALKIVGVAFDSAMQVADITTRFLRWVLTLLYSPVQMAARAALSRLA